MLHIFSVEKGDMLNVDMEYAFKSVLDLKNHIAQSHNIPVDKQVLLASGGKCMNPACTVSSYGSGTDTNPVFLFNKLLHVQQIGSSPEPQRQNSHSDKISIQLKKKFEENCLLESTLSNLKVRTAFAQDLLSRSADEVNVCKQKITEQHLQQQAWFSVIANLEDAVDFFKVKYNAFSAKYQEFQTKQKHFDQILETFNEDIKTLARVPLLAKLRTLNDGSAASMPGYGIPTTNLLEYVLSQDSNSTLELLSQNCMKDLENINAKTMQELREGVHKILALMNETSIKEIKGLKKRFHGLDELMDQAKSAVEEQKPIWRQMTELTKRATKEPQIVPELTTSIVAQMHQLHEKYKHLKDISKRCFKSKQELSDNIRVRLFYIGKAENQMSEYTKKITAYERLLQNLLRDMTKIEQIHTAPQVYARCMAEVVRRKRFSSQFIQWAGTVSARCNEVYRQELEHRKNYNAQIRTHFLNKLFPGLDDMPPPFATKNPKPFDDRLPPVDLTDIDVLKKNVPHDLMSLLETSSNLPSMSLMEIDSRSSSDISSKKAESDTASHRERMFEIPMAGSPLDGGYLTDNNSNTLMNHSEPVAEDTKMCVDGEDRERIRQCVVGIRQSVGAFAGDTSELAQEIQRWTQEFVGDAERVSKAFEEMMLVVHSQQSSLSRELEIEQHKREDAQREIENYYVQIRDVSDLLDNSKHEKQLLADQLTEKLTNLQMEHVLELERLEERNRKDLEQLESQLSDSQQEIRMLRRANEEEGVRLQQKQAEFEQHLRSIEDEYKKKEQASEKQHKMEMESLRCRYRMISDSGTSPPGPTAVPLEVEARFKQKEIEYQNKITHLENLLNSQNAITDPSNVVSPMDMDNPTLGISMNQSMFESQIRVIPEGSTDIQTLTLSSPNANNEALAAELKEQLRLKELEVQKLQLQLATTCGEGSVSIPSSDRVSILSCNKSDLVLLTFDDARENYVIFMLGPVLYFLHKDSLEVMNLSTDRERSTRRWIIGQVVDKEYCEARRANNRYKLSIGTRFFRVKVVPWDRQSAIKREQERRQILRAAGGSTQPTQGTDNPSVSSPALSI